MGLPEQERFTVEDVALLWGKSPGYVDELIRTLQFTHIIIVGERIGGSPLTRHLYFDRALWIENYGKKLQTDPGLRRKELEEKIARYKKEWRKKGLEFDSSTLRKAYAEDIGPTSYNIGQDEVANFYNPFPPRNEWKQPNEPVQVYIPRLAVEAFEKKHGLPGEMKPGKAKKQEGPPMPNPSIETPKGFRQQPYVANEGRSYPPKQAAHFLGVTEKHVYRLVDEGKLVAMKHGDGPKPRIEISGKEINRYNERHPA